MSTVAELCSQALEFHRSGDLNRAQQLYQQSLQLDPDSADAHHLLGVLEFQLGRNETAIERIRHAISLNPSAAPYHVNLGIIYNSFKAIDNAIECFGRAWRLNPSDISAFDYLAAALLIQYRTQEALAVCREALARQLEAPEIFQHLGHALSQLGRYDEAVAHYQRAVLLRPNYIEAHNNLGNLLHDLGRTDEAADHMRQALTLLPNSPPIYNNLARILHKQQRFDEAIYHYREAIRLEPNFAQAFNNLGSTLAQQRKFDEAVESYRQALRIDPNSAEARSNLGTALVHAGDADAAIEECRKAVALQPQYADAHNNLGGALLDRGNLGDAAESFQRAVELQPGLITAHSNLLFCMSYDPEADPDVVFAEHRRWGKFSAPAFRLCPGEQKGRLRIGYVSPDFRQHAMIRYFEPVLAHHDSEKVEVFCYAEAPQPDEVTARLQKLAQHWRSVRGLTNTQAAQLVHEDRIDILVDLAGHTAGNRLDIFSLKPAPIQVTWLGYLNTTGLKTIDYRLTDEVLDPPGSPVRDTEELYRLPGGFCCFQPWPEAPDVCPLPALSRGHLTFGSLHSLFKLNSRVYDLWSEVLRAIPDARFLMYRDTLRGQSRQRVLKEFRDRGIDEARLDLWDNVAADSEIQSAAIKASGMSRYLRVYNQIDVSLDAFPWSGGVTTCESLWMGVPMLSLLGNRPASRHSASLLSRVGLSDWACHTPQDFVAKSVDAGQNLDELASLRGRLRERMGISVCDAAQFTQSLEQAYWTFWRRWCAG